MSNAPLPVALIWHHHQPLYRDLAQRAPRGALRTPWVRLHALRDYHGMAAIVAQYPNLHVTFNWSPVLLEQLRAYEEGVTDAALELTLTRAERMTVTQRQVLTERFFDADWHHQIYPHARYTELLRLKLEGGVPAHGDLRDLQMWFNLAWFATELRTAPQKLVTGETASVARFIEQGRDFTHVDIEEMVHEQFKVLRAIVPLHRRLQAAGQIELSLSPYAHPILPLLIDSDRATVDRPATTLASRFHHPEDADSHLVLGIAEYERHFGETPRGMWPSEGAVCPDVIPLAARHGLQWIATDEGALKRSGRWGYDTSRADVRSRVYRARHDGGECAVFFRNRELSDLVGFEYQRQAADRAAADFVARLRARAEALQSNDREYCVTIVLDGENAWGAYPDDGRPFLHALYETLAKAPDLVAVTPSEFLSGNGQRSLQARRIGSLEPVYELATASWIDEPRSAPGADLGTWTGEPEENDAWECLGLVRDDLNGTLRTLPAESQAHRALLAAEGSDWFWWFGDDQDSDADASFEQLFLAHLRSAYILAGLTVPTWLPARLSVPVRVWSFTRPIGRLSRVEELVIVTPCPGILRWRLDEFARGELSLPVPSSVASRSRGPFMARLGPFREDARELCFAFLCRHPNCDGRGPCCDAREWKVSLEAA